MARRLGKRREGSERQFNPKETLIFPKGSYAPTINESMARSLDLFVETLSSIEDTDTRISTKLGRVEFADEYQGHRVIWILNVIDSIYMATNSDPHVSIRAIAATPSGQYYTSRIACVFTGHLPVGDYLANVVLMFHNNILVNQINTLDGIRREVLTSVKKAEKAEAREAEREARRQELLEFELRERERRAEQVAERAQRERSIVDAGILELLDEGGHFWPNFYEQLIAKDASMVVRSWAIGEIDLVNREELALVIDELHKIDCDVEPNFPSYRRNWLLRNLITAPICPNVRINMINRLDSIEIETVRELNALQHELERGIGDHEDTEGLLLDVTKKAIDRFRERHYDRMFASARRRR